MDNLTILKNALAESAEVPSILLDKIQYNGDNELLYDVLFPILGWDKDYQSFAHGQFMEYMEWKEPYIDFDKFFIIKNRQLTINTDDMFDDYEQEVGDEDEMDDMDIFDAYDLHLQYCFKYFNKKLAPHQLRLIDLGTNENAYFLLVHDDENQIENLVNALSKFDIPVLLK